jgi:uncharacterized caspase-like protein
VGVRRAIFGLVALALGTLLSIAAAAPAYALKRVALVVGNSSYKFGPLKNAANDAEAVGESLRKLGFEVSILTNVTENGFSDALLEFSGVSTDADQVVFYYAGHGVEQQKVPYLLPIDVKVGEFRDLEISRVPSVDTVARAMMQTAGLKILIIDACREDPYVKDITLGADVTLRNFTVRSTDEGVVRATGDGGRKANMLIVYSAASQRVAYDGTGSNGPFAASLVRHIAEPGLSVSDLFHKVNADVSEATDKNQLTSFYDSLAKPYILNLGESDEEAWRKLMDAPDPTSEDFDKFIERYKNSVHGPQAAHWRDLFRQREKEGAAAVEEAAWEETKKINTAAAYDGFAIRYPQGPHIAEAAKRRDSLKAEAAAWDAAGKDNTAEAYDRFLSSFSASDHVAEATRLRDQLRAKGAEAKAWDKANGDNTADGYAQFATANPTSTHKPEALHRRDVLLAAAAEAKAWEKANTDNTPDGYTQFATANPTSAHKPEALRRRDVLLAAAAEAKAWDRANADNTADGYAQFATANPTSTRKPEALRRRDFLLAASAEATAWEKANLDKTVEAFDKFVREHPSSAHGAEALHRRDDLLAAEAEARAWAGASARNSPSDYDQFAKAFPESPHAQESLSRRDTLLAAQQAQAERVAWASAQGSGAVAAYDRFIENFPHSIHIVEAQQRRDARAAVDKAQADVAARAAAEADICRKESERLAEKIAAHAALPELEALVPDTTCPKVRHDLDLALSDSQRMKDAEICAADGARLEKVKSDLNAVRNEMAKMSCERVLNEARGQVAKLEEDERRARMAAEASARMQEVCEAAQRDLAEVDLYDQPADARIVTIRDKSGCTEPGFQRMANNIRQQAASQVRETQVELKRVGCFSGAATGIFDDATKKALTAFAKGEAANVEPAAEDLRATPEMLARLRALPAAGACRPSEGAVAALPNSESHKTPNPPVVKLHITKLTPEPAAPAVVRSLPKSAPEPGVERRKVKSAERTPVSRSHPDVADRSPVKPQRRTEPGASPVASSAAPQRPQSTSVIFVPN